MLTNRVEARNTLAALLVRATGLLSERWQLPGEGGNRRTSLLRYEGLAEKRRSRTKGLRER
jgi:hypothetical protein